MTHANSKQYDLYGIGNALVDLEYQVEDAFLQRHGVAKGHMTLVDEGRLQQLAEALADQHPQRVSGGSAANTLMAAQGFGGRTFYSGKVAAEEVGRHFLQDLADAGIRVNASADALVAAMGQDADGAGQADGQEAAALGHSGRCLVLITPDAERSMNTFLGVSGALGPKDLDAKALSASMARISGPQSSHTHQLFRCADRQELCSEHVGNSDSMIARSNKISVSY